MTEINNIDELDMEGSTALQRFVRGGQKYKAILMCAQGANPYLKDRWGLSAVRIAHMQDWTIAADLMEEAYSIFTQREKCHTLFEIPAEITV